MTRNGADGNVGTAGESLEGRHQITAQASGPPEPDLLETLQSEGLSPDLLALLWIAPAIAMSWADGAVTRREHQAVGRLTRSDHVRATGRLGARLLNRWMISRPSDAFFRAATRALAATIAALPEPERSLARQRVMTGLIGVARVSGGVLSVGALSAEEQQWLQDVEAELAAPARERLAP